MEGNHCERKKREKVGLLHVQCWECMLCVRRVLGSAIWDSITHQQQLQKPREGGMGRVVGREEVQKSRIVEGEGVGNWVGAHAHTATTLCVVIVEGVQRGELQGGGQYGVEVKGKSIVRGYGGGHGVCYTICVLFCCCFVCLFVCSMNSLLFLDACKAFEHLKQVPTTLELGDEVAIQGVMLQQKGFDLCFKVLQVAMVHGVGDEGVVVVLGVVVVQGLGVDCGEQCLKNVRRGRDLLLLLLLLLLRLFLLVPLLLPAPNLVVILLVLPPDGHVQPPPRPPQPCCSPHRRRSTRHIALGVLNLLFLRFHVVDIGIILPQHLLHHHLSNVRRRACAEGIPFNVMAMQLRQPPGGGVGSDVVIIKTL